MSVIILGGFLSKFGLKLKAEWNSKENYLKIWNLLYLNKHLFWKDNINNLIQEKIYYLSRRYNCEKKIKWYTKKLVCEWRLEWIKI